MVEFNWSSNCSKLRLKRTSQYGWVSGLRDVFIYRYLRLGYKQLSLLISSASFCICSLFVPGSESSDASRTDLLSIKHSNYLHWYPGRVILEINGKMWNPCFLKADCLCGCKCHYAAGTLSLPMGKGAVDHCLQWEWDTTTGGPNGASSKCPITPSTPFKDRICFST